MREGSRFVLENWLSWGNIRFCGVKLGNCRCRTVSYRVRSSGCGSRRDSSRRSWCRRQVMNKKRWLSCRRRRTIKSRCCALKIRKNSTACVGTTRPKLKMCSEKFAIGKQWARNCSKKAHTWRGKCQNWEAPSTCSTQNCTDLERATRLWATGWVTSNSLTKNCRNWGRSYSVTRWKWRPKSTSCWISRPKKAEPSPTWNSSFTTPKIQNEPSSTNWPPSLKISSLLRNTSPSWRIVSEMRTSGDRISTNNCKEWSTLLPKKSKPFSSSVTGKPVCGRRYRRTRRGRREDYSKSSIWWVKTSERMAIWQEFGTVYTMSASSKALTSDCLF